MRSAILATGLLALAAAAPAHAAYVSNFTGWSKLNDKEKLAYVQGVNDASSVADSGDAFNPVQAGMVRGRVACLNRQQVSARMLVALIDTRYQTDPSARDLPPMTIYLRETYRMCREDIDASIQQANKAMEPETAAPASPH